MQPEILERSEVTKREVGEHIRLHLSIEKDATEDLGDGIFEAVITTSALDRHNENIVTGGIDTANYMASNPIVLYGHDYWGLPIGKTLKLTEMKNKIKAKFQLAYEEYDFAQTVGKLIQGGYLNTVSIGGIVTQWSEDYRTIEKMELLEFSIVSVPANPEAIITGRSLEKIAGKSIAAIRQEEETFVKTNVVDKLKNIGNDGLEDAIKTLETLLAHLKAAAQATASADDDEPLKRVKHIRLQKVAKEVATESQTIIKIVKRRSNKE